MNPNELPGLSLGGGRLLTSARGKIRLVILRGLKIKTGYQTTTRSERLELKASLLAVKSAVKVNKMESCVAASVRYDHRAVQSSYFYTTELF